MIRILHMVQNFHFGGMERIIAELVQRTNKNEFETHVMVLQFFGHFAQGLDNYATLHCAKPMSRASMLRPISLANELRAIKPDLVHLHSGVWYKGSLAARMAGVKRVVYTDHGRQSPDPWMFRTLDRMASRRTDIVVGVSEALADYLRTTIVHDDSRVRVVRNGVNTAVYAPTDSTGDLHQELGVAHDRPVIGSIGRLEPVKGYEVMIAAFAHLLATWTEPRKPVLVLIGDGSQRATLETRAQELGVLDDVFFLGWRNDTMECAREFTLFTMSSYSEGTSVSLLEAMSMGLCPVVTNVGGNPAVLGPQLKHRLTPPGDPTELAQAWQHALNDVTRRMLDGSLARQRVIDDYSLDSMVRNYEDLYRELHGTRANTILRNTGTHEADARRSSSQTQV